MHLSSPYLVIIGLIAHAGEAKFGCVYDVGVHAAVTDCMSDEKQNKGN